MSSPSRIVLVKLSAIGDVLHATPVADAIRRASPDVHLGWVVHKHCLPVIEGNPNIDQVHTWDRKRFWKDLWRVRKSLREARYQVAIDLQGLAKSGLVTRLSGAPKRFGAQEAREMAGFFYNRRMPDQAGQHILRSYLNRAAAATGLEFPEVPPMHFPVQEKDRAYARMLLGEMGNPTAPVVILNPSAGKPEKQWPPACFARLAEELENHGCTCLVTGAPADRALGNDLMHALHRRDLVHDVVGRTTLPQLAALLAEADLFIGGDTGPMHMAQAVGTRVVALFGPTDPRILGPLDPRDRVVSKFGENPDRAMHLITVDEVLSRVREILPLRSGVS